MLVKDYLEALDQYKALENTSEYQKAQQALSNYSRAFDPEMQERYVHLDRILKDLGELHTTIKYSVSIGLLRGPEKGRELLMYKIQEDILHGSLLRHKETYYPKRVLNLVEDSKGTFSALVSRQKGEIVVLKINLNRHQLKSRGAEMVAKEVTKYFKSEMLKAMSKLKPQIQKAHSLNKKFLDALHTLEKISKQPKEDTPMRDSKEMLDLAESLLSRVARKYRLEMDRYGDILTLQDKSTYYATTGYDDDDDGDNEGFWMDYESTRKNIMNDIEKALGSDSSSFMVSGDDGDKGFEYEITLNPRRKASLKEELIKVGYQHPELQDSLRKVLSHIAQSTKKAGVYEDAERLRVIKKDFEQVIKRQGWEVTHQGLDRSGTFYYLEFRMSMEDADDSRKNPYKVFSNLLRKYKDDYLTLDNQDQTYTIWTLNIPKGR